MAALHPTPYRRDPVLYSKISGVWYTPLQGSSAMPAELKVVSKIIGGDVTIIISPPGAYFSARPQDREGAYYHETIPKGHWDLVFDASTSYAVSWGRRDLKHAAPFRTRAPQVLFKEHDEMRKFVDLLTGLSVFSGVSSTAVGSVKTDLARAIAFVVMMGVAAALLFSF
ncbi:hypothetical protein EIP91_009168 [Steccherinum ochraceum]|uniref:Uncharacterized protein n=1 Tax=Steccherinum ochraceum TaxID=92696 RepID=A0A4R0RBQ1_9APHY|nr:hypothetical protein EIP91_009168 [Steccherinum ochraceum]